MVCAAWILGAPLQQHVIKIWENFSLFWHPFIQLAVLFAITLVTVMFARALQNMANLVLAVQKQKGEIVKLYGTETVGYFDTDNMS